MVILQVSCIIEALIKYYLETYHNESCIKKDWKYTYKSTLYSIKQNQEEIVGAKRKKVEVSVELFQHLISLAKKKNILDTNLSKKIDNIRKLRNKIHLYHLDEADMLSFEKKL